MSFYFTRFPPSSPPIQEQTFLLLKATIHESHKQKPTIQPAQTVPRESVKKVEPQTFLTALQLYRYSIV